MHSYGSYFLWHIRTEGRILFSQSGLLEGLLQTLPAYSRIDDDLNDYSLIAKDIRESLESGFFVVQYELAILASLVRNTCIAICYMHDKFQFGRVSPVKITLELLGSRVSFTIEEYEELYSFRLARIRKNTEPKITPTVELVDIWVTRVENLIKYALNRKENYYVPNSISEYTK